MNNSISMLPKPAVCRKCGWRSAVTLWRVARNDPTFPKPRQVSANRVAWVEAEIDAWLASRPVAAAYATSPKAA